MNRPSRALRPVLAAVFAALVLGPRAADGQQEPLTLRVSDAIGRAGSTTTLVVRTYDPRPVGQGQLCFRATGPRGATGPFVAIEEVRVFATQGDATWAVDILENGAVVDIQVDSPSGTINETDGPLLAIEVRLAETLDPGDRFTMELEPITAVQGPSGQAIPVDLRAGELAIVGADAPFAVEADGDEAAPGGLLVAGVTTAEPLALSSATFGLRVDFGVFHREPTFRSDPRYGQATVSVEHPEADLWVIELTSNGSLNEMVTGELVILSALAATDLAPGTEVALQLDPAFTEVFDASGMPVDLALADDVIEIVADGPILVDGFESGDLSAWAPPPR